MLSGLYILGQMSSVCGVDTLKSIYFASVHSHLSYGLCEFGATI